MEAAPTPAPRVVVLVEGRGDLVAVRALAAARGLVESEHDWGSSWCRRDLEDELIRALGPSAVISTLAQLGDLDRFRAFQRQQA